MKDAIRISSPADILGFIPRSLGFVPRESFVFLTMRGKTLGATLRVDAPPFAEPASFARYMVIDYLALDTQATAVLLAIYTASTPALGQSRPFHDHGEAVIQALETARTPLQDAWLVTPSHWQNLLCDSDAVCCPPEALESITDGQLNAELVFRGRRYQKTPAPPTRRSQAPQTEKNRSGRHCPARGAAFGPGTVG